MIESEPNLPQKSGVHSFYIRVFTLPSPTTYRFRVQRTADECSQDWRVWVQGADAYLGSRGTAHQYKASFHSSGQCHIGLSDEIRKSLIGNPEWEGKSRLFSRWQATPSSPTGDVVLLDLLIPGSYLDTVGPKPGKSVDLLSCPAESLVIIRLIKSSLPVDGPAITSSDTSFQELVRLSCGNASTLSVLYSTQIENDKYHEYLRQRYWGHYLAKSTATGRTFGSRVIAPTDPSIRVLLWDGRTEPKQWHEASARKLHALGPPLPA